VTRKFIDREEELSQLEDSWQRGDHLIIVYGRRRVGKTELLKRFMTDKPTVYYLCSLRKVQYNLRRFSHKVSEFLKIPRIEFSSFQDAFEALRGRGRVLVVIDEFGYLVRDDPGILSDFQEIVDEKLRDSEITLILCGSSVSLMETRVMGAKSPLYGRADRYLRVRPFKPEHLASWFPNTAPDDLIKIYAVTGGVARYLEFFSGSDVEAEIERNFFDPSSFLYMDAMTLLSEELRDYATYLQVLEAISLGYNRVTEIANYAFLQPKDVHFYLKVLSTLGIVRRIVPVLSPRKTKRGIYEIVDNYFDFWFAFVSPFQSEIESGYGDPVLRNFREKFPVYLGRVFERTVRDLIKPLLPFRPMQVGRWWHRDVEIDVVAHDDSHIAFLEVKWSDLSLKAARKLLISLMEKASKLRFDGKRYYGLVAKSITGKEELSKEGFIVYDLRDILTHRDHSSGKNT